MKKVLKPKKGHQLAEGSFGPTAQMTADRARAMQKADTLEAGAASANQMARMQQDRQSANIQEQAREALGATGGGPAAVAAMVKASQGANADANLGLAQQAAATGMQATAQAEGMRQQGQNSFESALQNEYNRRVTPYMNTFQNMSSLGASLGTQIAQSSSQQYGQDVMVNNPLAGLGGALNQLGTGQMNDAFFQSKDIYGGTNASLPTDTPFNEVAGTVDTIKNGNLLNDKDMTLRNYQNIQINQDGRDLTPNEQATMLNTLTGGNSFVQTAQDDPGLTKAGFKNTTINTGQAAIDPATGQNVMDYNMFGNQTWGMPINQRYRQGANFKPYIFKR